MDALIEQFEQLQAEVNSAWTQLDGDKLQKQVVKLEQQSQQPDFWRDQQAAQRHMQQLGSLQKRLQPWQQLRQELADALDLARMNDQSVATELAAQLTTLQQSAQSLKRDLQFSGPYDANNAILAIHAGAGGTDAQDWAQMLQRMYIRWAEQHHFQVSVIQESAGEEAGIKSATLEISGPFSYGKLKGEHGVHRLVRLSPFNADNLRQTSFAKVEVLPEIDNPGSLVIDDKALKIDVYRSGGHGGQSVNTTDSAVRVTHLPTGLVVAIQNERSQLQNKETALTILRSRLAQLQMEQHQAQLSALKGPNQSAEWGNQIRSYVLHPYKQVKDLRTKCESSDPDAVLNGDLDQFIDAYLESQLGKANPNLVS